MPIDQTIIDGRRRVVAMLDELCLAGLLSFSLTPPEIEGPEPHLEVWADKETLDRSAWGEAVSNEAAGMWELLRNGRFRIAPSLQAIQNVLDAGEWV